MAVPSKRIVNAAYNARQSRNEIPSDIGLLNLEIAQSERYIAKLDDPDIKASQQRQLDRLIAKRDSLLAGTN